MKWTSVHLRSMEGGDDADLMNIGMDDTDMNDGDTVAVPDRCVEVPIETPINT